MQCSQKIDRTNDEANKNQRDEKKKGNNNVEENILDTKCISTKQSGSHSLQ